MFHRVINEISPWTDRGLFENVQGGKYRAPGAGSEDVVMLASLRALLSRRLPEGVVFKTKVMRFTPGEDGIENPVQGLNNLAAVVNDHPDATICDIKNTLLVAYTTDLGDDKVAALVDNAKAKVLEIPGWSIHEKQHNYLNQYMKMVALLNKENNSAVIVMGAPSIDQWHLLGSMIPAYFTQMFTDVELQVPEKDMLHALTMHGSNTWMSKMALLEEMYDIRAKKIEQMIGGFEQRERESQKARVDNEIEGIRNSMNSLMRQYHDYCVKLDEANIRRNGLVYAIDNANDDNELVRFFQANKSLDVISTSGTRITFIVRTYFENFGNEGSDAYEGFRHNDRFFGEMEPNRSEVFKPIENRRKFLDALILQRKFKMLMCSVYHLDIMGHVNTTGGYDFPNNCADYVRNYHLDHHECFGDYRRIICDYLNRGDTIGAINACITSAKSINIEESGATFCPMMQKVFDTNRKCIELPDGSHVTPAKALEWLNEQEGNEHEAD